MILITCLTGKLKVSKINEIIGGGKMTKKIAPKIFKIMERIINIFLDLFNVFYIAYLSYYFIVIAGQSTLNISRLVLTVTMPIYVNLVIIMVEIRHR